MPTFVVHLHFDQHVAGEELALGDAFLATTHFDDLFDRHQNLAEGVLHAGTRDALDQRTLHGLFKA